MTKLEALLIRQQTERYLLAINQSLDMIELKEKGEQNMAVSTDVAAIISAMNDATNAIASRIAALVAAAGTLSADDKAAFATEVANLQALGADPNNPVPPATS